MPGLSSTFVKGMVKDMYGYMWDAERYDDTAEPWKDLYAEKGIDGGYWQTTSVVGMGSLRKTSESEGYNARTPVEGYTVYGKPFIFTDMIEMTYTAVEDHQKIENILRDAAASWGGAVKTTRNEFFVTWFLYGGYTAGHENFNGTPDSGAISDASGDGCYDGLVAAVVPNFALTGGTYKHVSSVGGSSYFNAKAVDLDPDNFETLYNLMTVTNNRDENDKVIPNIPNVLVVSRQLNFTARRLLESTLIPGEANNDKNVLNSIVDLKVWDHFTDTDGWVLGCKKKGITRLKRQEPKIRFFESELNRRYYAAVEMRDGAYMDNWRRWHGSNLPTS